MHHTSVRHACVLCVVQPKRLLFLLISGSVVCHPACKMRSCQQVSKRQHQLSVRNLVQVQCSAAYMHVCVVSRRQAPQPSVAHRQPVHALNLLHCTHLSPGYLAEFLSLLLCLDWRLHPARVLPACRCVGSVCWCASSSPQVFTTCLRLVIRETNQPG